MIEMKDLKERLKERYSWTEEEFSRYSEEPSFSCFPDISSNSDFEKAKRRLRKAKEAGEKVIVYGDYDCDGILGTSIVVWCLLEYGIKAKYFIPSRYLDGYGLTLANAKKIADSGYTLVICVDNGVSCFDAVAFLLSKGIDTIILDHHEFPETLPPSLSLIHPITLGIGEKGGFNISAGFVSFLFSNALLSRIDSYFLCLAAITTLSDMMPLSSINREIVRLSLRIMRKAPIEEISFLASRRYMDEKALKMEVIPIINALGRMNEGRETMKAVDYFAFRDPSSRLRLSAWMKEANRSRKQLLKDVSEKISYVEGSSGVCLNLDIKEGLNGLLANKIMKAHHVPCAIFSPKYNDPEILVGSLRAEKGFSLIDFFSKAKAFALTSGGHDRSGGLTIKTQDFPSFKKFYLSYCASHPFIEDDEPLIPLSLSEATMDSYRVIRAFGPFGEGHPEPVFVLANLDVDGFVYSKDGKYLMTPLGDGVKLSSFELGRKDFAGKEKTSLAVKFELDEYKGKVGLRLNATSFPRKG